MTEKQKEEIYRTYYGKVSGYIRTKLRNEQEAEDLAADVFVKVYEKLDSFDESKASLSTWIYTITRNTLTDHFRTRRVHDELPEELVDGFSVEDEIFNAEMLEKLADALESLDKRRRDILILHFYSGKTLKEIAAQMGISYTYVKVLQNSALHDLKNFF